MKNTLVVLFMILLTVITGNAHAQPSVIKLSVDLLKNSQVKILALGYETYQGKVFSAKSLGKSISKMPITEVLELNQLEFSRNKIIYPGELKFAYVKMDQKVRNYLSKGQYGKSPMGNK